MLSNKSTIIFLLFIGLISGCEIDRNKPNVLALTPIYGTLSDLQAMISVQSPRDLSAVGKIYTYNQWLFINERNVGVHVFDNSNPSSPSPIQFITIPGNIDLAIHHDFLYADMGVGIVTIDITDIAQPQVTAFEQAHIGEKFQLRPPTSFIESFSENKVYFECPNPSKGTIISWDLNTIQQPDCYLIK